MEENFTGITEGTFEISDGGTGRGYAPDRYCETGRVQGFDSFVQGGLSDTRDGLEDNPCTLEELDRTISICVENIGNVAHDLTLFGKPGVYPNSPDLVINVNGYAQQQVVPSILYPNANGGGIAFPFPPYITGDTGCIAYNPLNNNFYAPSGASGEVIAYDITNNITVANFPFSSNIPNPMPPGAMVSPFNIVYNPNNNRAFLSVTGSNWISIIDCGLNAEIGTFVSAGTVQYIALDPSTDKLYAIVDGTSNIEIYDTTGLGPAPINTINVGDLPAAIVHFNNGVDDYIGVVKSDVASITIIDTDTDTFVNFPANQAMTLDYFTHTGICFDNNANNIYYSDGTGAVHIFDTINNVMIPNALNPFGMECTNFLFVDLYNIIYTWSYTVVKLIDTTTNSEIQTINFLASTPIYGGGMIYSPTNNVVYIAPNDDFKVSSIPIIANIAPPPVPAGTGQSMIQNDINLNIYQFCSAKFAIALGTPLNNPLKQTQIVTPLYVERKSINGKIQRYIWQSLNQLSPTTYVNLMDIIEYLEFNSVIDNDFYLKYLIQPGMKVCMYFKLKKRLDFSDYFYRKCMVKEAKHCEPKGNPIYDIAIQQMAKDILNEKIEMQGEVNFWEKQVSDYPRLTGNDIADTQILFNYDK